jgi:hypothetical protein
MLVSLAIVSRKKIQQPQNLQAYEQQIWLLKTMCKFHHLITAHRNVDIHSFLHDQHANLHLSCQE